MKSLKSLAALVLLLAAAAPALAGLDRYEAAIKAFEAADKRDGITTGGILFVGSSSIRKWTTLAEDFPGRKVLNRGFGGSTMAELNHYAARIVVPYEPRVIVLYEGDNDIAGGRTPERVLADFRVFSRFVREKLPGTRIVFVSIKPSPSRWKLRAKFEAANGLIRKECRADPALDYADVWTPMLLKDGRPRGDLFLGDRLHMNRAGYRLWTGVITPFLD